MPDSAPLPESSAGDRIEWGRGDPRHAGSTGSLSMPATASPDELATAVAVVALRYAAGGRARIAVVDERGCRVNALTVDRHPTVAAVRSALSAGEPPADPLPAIGVVLAGHAAPRFALTVEWTAAGLTCRYDRGAVDAPLAAQFARHVRRLATTLPSGLPVPEVELVDDVEAAELLAAGRTAATAGRAGTIPELFRETAVRRGAATAVSDADRALDYAGLDARSDRLAAGLAERGIGRGDLVGVCLEREIDLVATVLAVLKAGAAYVPMDTRYPPDRLRRTTEDAGLALVVTTVGDFPEVAGVPTVRPNLLASPGAVPPTPTDPDAPAYVIHTSGSTGRPKGVVVAHRNVVALLAATEGELDLGEADVWSLLHSSAFDVSVFEMWGCLLTGAHLVVVPHWAARSPEELHRLLAERAVTVLGVTPSAFTPLRDAHLRGRTDLALRLVVLAGEPLDVRVLREWFLAVPPRRCRVVNMFGITETTVHSTVRTVTPADVEAGSRSVGTALPGWTVSVRDPRGRPEPFGVAGEIHVGGAGVAEGYLGRPELTAERFGTDEATGERTYRSGDLGRLWPDGSLEHLGRLDDQVKLRGFRIEPGEVRTALLDCPGVRAAAVRLHRGAGDAADARLDAYVVLAPGTTAAAVRFHARACLPEHMVPATVTVLSELPLTVNGKVDPARLPAPDPLRPAVAEVLPGGLVTAVLGAWRTALHPALGPDDDFFDHGGNSLLAVRLAAALRRVDLPAVTLRELYQHPTAARLAEHFTASSR